MKLYHATPAENLPAILRYGLDPGADGLGAGSARVHLGEDPEACRGFVAGLYAHAGLSGEVVVLEVDVDGIVLELGDDDWDGEWAVSGWIEPARLKVI